jgi:hypothetical protein
VKQLLEGDFTFADHATVEAGRLQHHLPPERGGSLASHDDQGVREALADQEDQILDQRPLVQEHVRDPDDVGLRGDSLHDFRQ